ncbi:hypothetical protein AVR91_0207705 [Amycolatopsis keratiniphila subsp. keratiniphila]|uniref:Uncharacterized protein n=1 Tax=Amycolatopsis keratiniphila subsp. keratiniphila TaxID=227715 RepID=A0A1W2M0K4_9PSEU|nr:hypothetical protein AVR91_0207705 [Amycolatopsis keratiniphila subsp. keratiniphila]
MWGQPRSRGENTIENDSSAFASAFTFNGVGGYVTGAPRRRRRQFRRRGADRFIRDRVNARGGSVFFMLIGAETRSLDVREPQRHPRRVDLVHLDLVKPVTDPDGDAVKYCFRIATGADAKSGVVVESGCLPTPTLTVPVWGSCRTALPTSGRLGQPRKRQPQHVPVGTVAAQRGAVA